MESVFLGSFVRYRVYKGTGNTGTEEFDFTMPEFTFGLNIGKRWVWNSGFNITLALGYGFANNSKKPDIDNVSFINTLNKFEDEYEFLSPFLGEFSLGYAFELIILMQILFYCQYIIVKPTSRQPESVFAIGF